MVRTLSLESTLNSIKKSTNNTIINKILSNPVLLSIVIVLFITIIIINSITQKNKPNQLFKSIVFSVLITSGLLFCHNTIIKNTNNKQGKQEMASYFGGIAQNSTSNISNINNHAGYNEINGGELDNLDIDDFFR